ncbi:hypothetical protein CHELA1G11_12507 [Hyphomicrobiales bacterium]|nr:hypothetical protein CHELA1G2_11798 [Hyphomicrobiales bacterium]CAH1665292.1 hypothetical protein CHELA1G11_12507 [Hyphomicrobiales bacterium]
MPKTCAPRPARHSDLAAGKHVTRRDDATTTRIRDWVARFEPRLRIDRRFPLTEDVADPPPASIHQIGFISELPIVTGAAR